MFICKIFITEQIALSLSSSSSKEGLQVLPNLIFTFQHHCASSDRDSSVSLDRCRTCKCKCCCYGRSLESHQMLLLLRCSSTVEVIFSVAWQVSETILHGCLCLIGLCCQRLESRIRNSGAKSLLVTFDKFTKHLLFNTLSWRELMNRRSVGKWCQPTQAPPP